MSVALRFDRVSKHYLLGAGMKSLRETLSHAFQRLGRFADQRPATGSVLWALKNVSFDLQRGQGLGLVGPNGAGKTTVLKLLSNITYPSSGQVTVDGQVSALIELGAGFHPDLTGKENLYLNAAILGISRREMVTKFQSIVDFSGLGKFMDTPVKRYSSGMYVRLGFSVAAHIEPDILLVDEVLAVGDASFQRKCIERIHQLRRNGTTIVFVSHNMNLVRSVCDRGIFLQDGQIQCSGTVVEAIRAYEAYLHDQARGTAVVLNDTQHDWTEGSGIVHIEQIAISGENGRTHGSYSYRDAVRVGVTYQTREVINSPSLLARVIRSDGTTCCELRTRNDGVWLSDINGRGLISFWLDPLQLASGVYLIEVRIQDQADAVPLGVAQSDWFSVSGPGVTVAYEYAGVFVPHVRWDPSSISGAGAAGSFEASVKGGREP